MECGVGVGEACYFEGFGGRCYMGRHGNYLSGLGTGRRGRRDNYPREWRGGN